MNRTVVTSAFKNAPGRYLIGCYFLNGLFMVLFISHDNHRDFAGDRAARLR